MVRHLSIISCLVHMNIPIGITVGHNMLYSAVLILCYVQIGFGGSTKQSTMSQVKRFGNCTAAGLLLCRTFDTTKFQFKGTCRKVLTATTVDLPSTLLPLSVVVEPRMATDKSRRVYIDMVDVDVLNHRFTFQDNGIISVDDAKLSNTQGQLKFGSKYVVFLNYSHTVSSLRAAGMFSVKYESRGPAGRHIVTVIMENSGYAGKLKGLCGNWNGKKTDDIPPILKAADSKSKLRYEGKEVRKGWTIGGTECKKKPIPTYGI